MVSFLNPAETGIGFDKTAVLTDNERLNYRLILAVLLLQSE